MKSTAHHALVAVTVAGFLIAATPWLLAETEPAKSTPDDVVHLSPISVDSFVETDDYPAADTLAGKHVRIDLKDLGENVTLITKEFLEKVATLEAAKPHMEVVFVLDTTGSMSNMIEGAKRKIWAVASRLKSALPTPDIRFGLVAYRDRGDQYVTKLFPLTADIDAMYGELMQLTAAGGGDTPESVNEALAQALNSAGWSTDRQTFRAIFLVGDAPPHFYADDVPWDRLAPQAAERGIIINGLQCGDDRETARVWQGIARLAGGDNAQILDANRAVPFEYRFDADIVGMNRALETTIIPYGTPEQKVGATKARVLLQAMTAEGVADRASFLSKGEYGSVMTGGGDLVAEIIAGRITPDKIDRHQLDPAWAAKKPKLRTAEIDRLVERRRTLLKEISVLLKERESLLAAKLSGTATEGERLVLSPFAVVETQAKKKGFRFE